MQLQYKKKLLFIGIIWLAGACSGSIQFIYTKVVSFKFGSQTLYDCRENLPEEYAKMYTIYLFVSAFGLPMIILVYVYSIIGYQVWRHVAPGNPNYSRDYYNTLTREKVSILDLF